MKLSVLLHTDDYRGDHAADVVEAYEALDGETVAGLAERLLRSRDRYRYRDHIEIRVVVEDDEGDEQ